MDDEYWAYINGYLRTTSPAETNFWLKQMIDKCVTQEKKPMTQFYIKETKVVETKLELWEPLKYVVCNSVGKVIAAFYSKNDADNLCRPLIGCGYTVKEVYTK